MPLKHGHTFSYMFISLRVFFLGKSSAVEQNGDLCMQDATKLTVCKENDLKFAKNVNWDLEDTQEVIKREVKIASTFNWDEKLTWQIRAISMIDLVDADIQNSVFCYDCGENLGVDSTRQLCNKTFCSKVNL